MHNLYIFDRYENGKFHDYWIDPSSIIAYSSKNYNIGIVSSNPSGKDRLYTDPLGKSYKAITYKEVESNSPLLSSVVISRSSKGTRVFPHTDLFSKYVTMPHTAGYSLNDLNYYLIDYKLDSNYQGLVPEKLFRKYSEVTPELESYYHSDSLDTYRELSKAIDSGKVTLIDFDPMQYILTKIHTKYETTPRNSDYVGVALNYVSINTPRKFSVLYSRLEDIYKKTGLKFKIRFHDYMYGHIIDESEFLSVVTNEEMTEFEFADYFSKYIVDGTGLGYKIAYRSKLLDRPCDIYYADLSKKVHHNFRGIDLIDCLPLKTMDALIKNESSNYSNEVIEETYGVPLDEIESIPDKLINYMIGGN